MEVKREIHVNGYEIGQGVEEALISLGFSPDPFLQTGTRHTPPHHFTFATYTSTSERDYVWKKALRLVKDDNNFRGYIESETIPEKFCRKFDPTAYSPDGTKFPLPRCETIDLPPGRHKASDIHVKRHGHPSRDELEDLFLERNFYKVCTPRNTIFTFQTESFEDAKEAYARLVEYFERTGGVKQVDLEITGKFFRKPADFPVASVVPKGYLT
ncbi:MAG: hypothetical protein HY513_03800 [Candidatus Aenigmarchaeota archaeon]|nr:hypothetical protein [Candidatus Aenigmarchaeota archaeon]